MARDSCGLKDFAGGAGVSFPHFCVGKGPQYTSLPGLKKKYGEAGWETSDVCEGGGKKQTLGRNADKYLLGALPLIRFTMRNQGACKHSIQGFQRGKELNKTVHLENVKYKYIYIYNICPSQQLRRDEKIEIH